HLVEEDTAGHLHGFDALGREQLAERGNRRARILAGAAGEDVDGRVAVLRPRVDVDVRLREDSHPGYADGLERIHPQVEQRDVAGRHHLAQRLLNNIRRVQVLTTPELQHQV